MKILLIMPDAGIHRLNLGPVKISFREAPLTLTTLAALVPPELNAEIRIVDESIQTIPFEEPFDLVGISCLTGTALRGYEIADRFRALGATVILGGIHATLRPGEAHEHADAVVIGFAETTWPELLHDAANGGVRAEYHSRTQNLEGLPHPRRDLQKSFAYMSPNTVFASRGCKRSCEFCTVAALPFGWQTRPVGEVIDEIRKIPARRIVFNDVSLTEDREYARELFKAMIPLKKKWGGLATVSVTEDDELLDLMQQSGCIYLLLGFETLTGDGLAALNKTGANSVSYRLAMHKLHERGIIVQGCFILGLDQDDKTVFERTLEAINDLEIDIPRLAIFTPYPETRAFARLSQEGRILHQFWPHYDTQHVVFEPAQMSPAELDLGFRKTYQKAFSIASITRRTLHSRYFPVAFFGNLAYRIYVRRLKNDTARIHHEATTRGLECLT